MPNKPRPENRHRMVRVEDDLWQAAGEAAAAESTTRSEVMRLALVDLVRRNGLEDSAPAAEWVFCGRGPCSRHDGHDGSCDY